MAASLEAVRWRRPSRVAWRAGPRARQGRRSLLLVGPEGTGSLDIRATFRTDDGPIVFWQAYGRLDASRGLQLPTTIYVAPRFDWRRALRLAQPYSGDWQGIVHEDLMVEYEWYEVR